MDAASDNITSPTTTKRPLDVALHGDSASLVSGKTKKQRVNKVKQGRPSALSQSQQRKLIRLYVYTNLPLDVIRRLVEKFGAKQIQTRAIQYMLKGFLFDRYHLLRPISSIVARQRIAQIRDCKHRKITRHKICSGGEHSPKLTEEALSLTKDEGDDVLARHTLQKDALYVDELMIPSNIDGLLESSCVTELNNHSSDIFVQNFDDIDTISNLTAGHGNPLYSRDLDGMGQPSFETETIPFLPGNQSIGYDDSVVRPISEEILDNVPFPVEAEQNQEMILDRAPEPVQSYTHIPSDKNPFVAVAAGSINNCVQHDEISTGILPWEPQPFSMAPVFSPPHDDRRPGTVGDSATILQRPLSGLRKQRLQQFASAEDILNDGTKVPAEERKDVKDVLMRFSASPWSTLSKSTSSPWSLLSQSTASPWSKQSPMAFSPNYTPQLLNEVDISSEAKAWRRFDSLNNSSDDHPNFPNHSNAILYSDFPLPTYAIIYLYDKWSEYVTLQRLHCRRYLAPKGHWPSGNPFSWSFLSLRDRYRSVGYTGRVKIDLYFNYNIQWLDVYGNTALHIAATLDANFDTLKNIVDCGVDVNRINSAGQTFLHCYRTSFPCIWQDDPKADELLQCLIQKRFDFRRRDVFGRNIPIHFPHNIRSYMRKRGVIILPQTDCDFRIREIFLQEADCESIRRSICLKGVNTNSRNSKCDTLLHLSIKAGDIAATKLLLGHQANVHARNNRGQGVLAAGEQALQRAKGDAGLYARITACMSLATDAGAIAKPSLHEEWRMPNYQYTPGDPTIPMKGD